MSTTIAVIGLLVLAVLAAADFSLPLPRVLRALPGARRVSLVVRVATSAILGAGMIWAIVIPLHAWRAFTVGAVVFSFYVFLGDLMAAGVIVEDFDDQRKSPDQSVQQLDQTLHPPDYDLR